ncbi:Glutamate N-acetyltransferase [Candidatus Methanoperedenaceae archaeon GB50]|nr:Glutamate N-acetyltransferase [Candidatus Methanoperedenaceae archaeon GB50]CAD7772198.1 MAG: Glutamate N-acetyltransferase [Candidatus Methanoperedenaceae archaeon GB50]
MKPLNGGICAVDGIRAWGARDGRNGLAIILAEEEGRAAAVYTRNRIIAAPLIVTRRHLESQKGKVKGIVVNSGNANACTGKRGIEDAERTCDFLAERLGCSGSEILVASTGIIGRPLQMDLITEQIERVLPLLRSESRASERVASVIMTTDTYPKEYAVETDQGLRVGGVAKGSGMIAPDMGTMLAFITTDAKLPPETMHECLKRSVDESFNMIVVDGDTSTNDMAVLISTGERECREETFQEALDTVSIELAKMIARDGEGATKLIEVTTTGAKTRSDAKRVTKTIITSPLVKTAVFGGDPNWGRIIAAAGRSKAEINPERITLQLSDSKKEAVIIENGRVEGATDEAASIMKSETVKIHIDLGIGRESATGWGCDLSYDYVRINAEYTT